MYHCQVIFNKITVYYQTMWRKFLDRIASWHKSDFSIKHKGTNINCIFVLNCGTQFSFLVLIAHFINFLCSALKFVAHNEIPLMILASIFPDCPSYIETTYNDMAKLSLRQILYILGVQQCIQWIWLFWSQEFIDVWNYLNSTVSIGSIFIILFYIHWFSSKSVLDNISVSLWFQKQ